VLIITAKKTHICFQNHCNQQNPTRMNKSDEFILQVANV